MDDSSKVQVFATAGNYHHDFELLEKLKVGDIIIVEGCPGRAKKGELSVRPTMITPKETAAPVVKSDDEEM